jgi:hypothetical protein
MATLLTSQSFASSKEPKVVTLCQLISRAERYQGKLVKVAAFVIGNGLENAVLSDSSCPESPLTPQYSGKPEEVPGAPAVQLALIVGRGQPGKPDPEVSAEFTGSFELRPKESTKWVLHVTSISNVKWKTK